MLSVHSGTRNLIFRQHPSSQVFAFVIAFVFVFLPLWLYLSSSLCCFRVHLKSLNALVTGGRGVLGISAGRGAHPFGLRLSQGTHSTAQCAFWVVRWPCSQNGPVSDTIRRRGGYRVELCNWQV